MQTQDIIDAICEGILVLRSRDGVQLTDHQAQERANNIATVIALELQLEANARRDRDREIAAATRDALIEGVQIGTAAQALVARADAMTQAVERAAVGLPCEGCGKPIDEAQLLGERIVCADCANWRNQPRPPLVFVPGRTTLDEIERAKVVVLADGRVAKNAFGVADAAAAVEVLKLAKRARS